METKIKICGLFGPEDGEAVEAALPDYAGFVFAPKSRRYIPPEAAGALRRRLPPSVVTVGVFVDAPVDLIAGLYRAGTIGVIQLHGRESAGDIAALRRALPGAEIWKAYPIQTGRDLKAAADSAADRVLLDNGGGTGRSFDWALIRDFPRPFLLAGGLTPENIPEAIARFHPYAVDLSSGVESGGVKDREKIRAAVAAARGG